MNFLQFNWDGLAEAVFFSAGLNYIRYFFMAGLVYYLFFHRPPTWLKPLEISKSKRPLPQNKRDVFYSFLSISIFGIVGILTYMIEKAGWTQLYKNVDEYGWAWWFLSLPVMVFIHDTYFYWTHYLMHNKKLFPYFHKILHLSKNPTPLTSYAFHPLEAIIEAGIYPLLAIIIPLHQGALLLFFTFAFAYNILGHLGHELYPAWFIHSPLGKIFTTTTHHHQHHQKFNCNYGYYFTIWDRLIKTNHQDYEIFFRKNSTDSSQIKRLNISEKNVLKK